MRMSSRAAEIADRLRRCTDSPSASDSACNRSSGSECSWRADWTSSARSVACWWATDLSSRLDCLNKVLNCPARCHRRRSPEEQWNRWQALTDHLVATNRRSSSAPDRSDRNRLGVRRRATVAVRTHRHSRTDLSHSS